MLVKGKSRQASGKGSDTDFDNDSIDAAMPHQAIPTPTFDGTTDVEDFLKQFNAIADLNRSGTEEKELHLTTAIKALATRGIDRETYAKHAEVQFGQSRGHNATVHSNAF